MLHDGMLCKQTLALVVLDNSVLKYGTSLLADPLATGRFKDWVSSNAPETVRNRSLDCHMTHICARQTFRTCLRTLAVGSV